MVPVESSMIVKHNNVTLKEAWGAFTFETLSQVSKTLTAEPLMDYFYVAVLLQ